MTREQAKEVLRDEIAMLRQSIAVARRGNEEQDDAYLWDVAISSALILAGKCPNGHGDLDTLIPGQATCHVCAFTQFSDKHL